MTTEELIHDLRQLGKYSTLEPNWLLLSADKIEELENSIVRCKDCKHWIYWADQKRCSCIKHHIQSNSYDFCSYGERKESEVDTE